QSPALDKKLSVEENLVAHGYLYGLSGSRLKEKVNEVLKLVGLEARRHDRVEKLSGGLARRVEIAKGILHDPEVLILDEPTNGLDPLVRREVWDHLASLRDKGMTILVTTHLMEEAERCDEVAMIDKGKIVACGSPASLRDTMGGEVLSIRSSDS